MTIIRAAAIMLIATMSIAAGKVPSAYDGYAQAYVDDGKQNYPVTLYGVAEKWDKKCRQGKASECDRLAQALEDGLGDLKRDMRAATGYWIWGCSKGSATACARAATILRDGLGGFVRAERASEFAAKGCSLSKDGAACASLAMAMYRGDGMPQDKARAIQTWQASCAAGTEDGCRLQAGALFYESESADDHRRALGLFSDACGRDTTAWGCTGLAKAYSEGRGVAADQSKAADYARRACFAGEGDTAIACAMHGANLTRSGVPADVKLGSTLLTKSCLAGIADACNEAGLVAGRNPSGSGFADWEEALSFRDGCDLGLAAACYNLGRLYRDGNAKLPIDKGSAFLLFDAACKGNDQRACAAKGAVTSAPRPAISPALSAEAQLDRAVKAAKNGQGTLAFDTVARLMQEAVAEAEWLLAGWFYYGEPGVIDTPNQRNGRILFENAARQGHVEAAIWVGMAYWYGDGFPQNRPKGEGYMAIAANAGNEMAGAILRSMKMEPVREANARAAAEAAKRAEERKNDWGSWIAQASRQWASTASSYSPPRSDPMAASWARYEARQDNSNFNNAMNYYSGRSTVCPSFNKYC